MVKVEVEEKNVALERQDPSWLCGEDWKVSVYTNKGHSHGVGPIVTDPRFSILNSILLETISPLFCHTADVSVLILFLTVC